MNRIYRLCWNAATSQWVVASELAKRAKPSSGANPGAQRAPRIASIALAVSLALGAADVARAGQTGGQVVAGSGSINQNGAITTINQASQKLSLNWQSFNVAANETVNFVQPGASSIAVNRILGNDASQIFGHLNANGQVWLINPNGVVFGQGAQVNVGSLVASTLDTPDASLSSNTRTFSGNGKGSIVNKGNIRAANGGYVALLGNTVSNQGTVTAQLGTVAMGAGSAVTLTFDGSQLMHLQVDRSTLDNLVENRQLVQADGGRVIMTAGAADSLLASTVNNTGVVRAQTVENRNGQIVLLAGMKAGHVNVEGSVDASAPNGGDGGTIETSGAFAHIGAASINASAAAGKAGTWLVDPYDLTIDDTAATTISNSLQGGTNVTQQTTANSASLVGVPNANGVGDINVDSAISWTNAATTLTLDAYRAINVNAPINGAGGVVMHANGNGGNGTITLASGGTITGGTGITLTAANAFVNNAGTAALNSASGRWLIRSANPTANTLGGLTPGFIQYNANAGTAAAQATGNGLLYSLAPTVNITGLTGSSHKTYDGGTAGAPLTDANIQRTGLQNGDLFGTIANGTYASKDAASGLGVTSSNQAASYAFTDATGFVPVYGYKLTGMGVSANIGVIDPKQLTINVIGNPTKTYNGTMTASLTSANYQTLGLVGSESITFAQPSSVAYDSADAGPRTVNATFQSSNFVAANGTKLSNYVLPSTATGAGTINRAKVQLSGLIGTDKVYDGTATDALDTSGASIFGIIAADSGQVTLDGTNGTGQFGDANVGNGKAIIASGFALTGGRFYNYDLVAPTDLTGSITPKTLTVNNLSALGKVYDATTLAQLNVGSAQLLGIVPADSGKGIALDTGSVTANFATKNVGNGIGVTVSGLGLTGSGVSNYRLDQPAGLSANITPAPLSLAITGNPTRTYNGTANANIGAGNVTITGFQGSDSGSITQSAGASYDSKDAGARTITAQIEASDFRVGAGTSLSNYTFATSITGAGTISPILLSYSIVGNPTKTYDGTTAATLGNDNYQVYGWLTGEGGTVTQTHGTYDDPNVGLRGVTANLTAADFSPLSGTNLGNYAFPATANGFGTIVPAAVSGHIDATLNGVTKTYDGNTSAILNASNFVLTGFVNGDGASVNQTVGTFASKNVGKQPLSAVLDPATNFDANPGTNLGNYTLPTIAYGTGEIVKAILTANIISGSSKVYDGTTYVALKPDDFRIDGFAPDEGAQINPSSSSHYDDKNVGTGKTITATMANSSYIANSNTLLSNYELDLTATGTGSITAAPLYVVGVSANSRTYDRSTAATLDSSGAGLVGLVGADTNNVTLTKGTTGTFATANAGTGIGVTASGFSIGGTEASNYILQPISGLTANITPFALTISGVSTSDKDYDGTRDITLNTGTAVLDGVLAGDESAVSLVSTGALGQTRTADARASRTVTTSGFALSGAGAGNYSVSQVSGLTATINKKQLAATIIGDPTKPYDGSNAVTLHASDYSLTGFATGQGASIPQSSSAKYQGVNAGNHVGLASTLSVSDFVANSGTNLANYILPTTASGALGTITPFVIVLTGTRQYDATTRANAGLFTSTGRLAGVNGEEITLGGFGTLSSKNVAGGPKTLTDVSTFTLGDASGLAINYSVAGSATITKAPLTVIGSTVTTRDYDQTVAAAINLGNFDKLFSGDVVSVVNGTAGTFNNKNAGSNKAVNNTMSIAGADAGNYAFTRPTLTGTILPKGIDITAAGIDKVYDGTTTADASLDSAGKLTGDDLGYSKTGTTFDTKDVGNGKLVTVTGLGLTGGDAGNYKINNAGNSTTTTAKVTPRPINLNGTKIYDAGTNAAAGMLDNNGVVTGVLSESLTVGGFGTLSSKNVGSYKFGTANGFDVSTFSLTGNGATLASNYTLVGGTHTFTVTPYAVVVGATGIDRTYDATTGATVNLVRPTLLGSDVVDFGYGSASFLDKNAGNGKQVNVTGIVASGQDAGNYSFATTTTTTANIAKLAINGTILADDKVYDGGVNAVTRGSLAGVLGTDDIDYTATRGTFGDKNVDAGKVVTVAGTIGGIDAGNYIVTSNPTTLAAITPLAIVVGASALNKVYDGNTTAITSLTPTGFIAGDDLAFAGGASNFSDANASNGKTVTVTGITGSGADIRNYSFNTSAQTVADITPYVISLHGERVYNGSATVNGSVFGNAGLIAGINGDVLSLTGAGSVADKNVGTEKPLTSTGSLALQNNGGALGSNYTLVGGTHWATIDPLSVVVDATGSNKVYDGNTSAVAGLASGGIVAGDTVTFAPGTTNYSDKNAATGKTITVDGITASGTDAANYRFNTIAQTTGDITPLAIVGSITAGSKTYDGTTATMTSGTLAGVLAGDDLGLTTGGTFADKNAGAGKTVNVAGTLTGGDAGNYVVTTNATTLADVYKVVLNLDGTRVYDGTAVAGAGMFGNKGVVAGVAGETLTLSGNGTLVNKNVASNRTLAGLGSLALAGNNGALADNYTLLGGTHVATVTPLGIVAAVTADDKVYDGNTIAATHGALTGVVAGDDVGLSTSGLFVDRNAGNGKTVNVDGRIGGGDAGNYVLTVNPTTTASITRRPVVVSAQGIDKYFDGNRDAKVNLSSGGILPGDIVAFGAGSALFADPAVGNVKPVSVDGIVATGADAGNYAFNTTTSTQANIKASSSQGASAIAIAQLDAVLAPQDLATPYGLAWNLTVGPYTGNHKKTRQPVEKNVQRSDFVSGLSLEVLDGGVRGPADAMR